MNTKTLLALAALLLPLMFASVACDGDKPMPCVDGPGLGNPGTSSGDMDTSKVNLVQGTYKCNGDGTKTFTPDPPKTP